MYSFVAIDGIAPHLPRCVGNPCLLLYHDAPPLENPAAEHVFTQCQTWPVLRGGETVIAVRCYGASGQLIECCGHGLLAAAHKWQRLLQCHTVCLSMNGSLVPSWQESNLTWLRFTEMHVQDCAIPDWLPQVFGATPQPKAAAIAGDDCGYQILQWPDGFDLQCLSRPGAALAECTARALVCTAAMPEWGPGAVQLRYFAPQYGVVEDAATGSAMRVLAQYWSPRFSQLVAYQCSAEGGLLLSRHDMTHVEIGGRCVVA